MMRRISLVLAVVLLAGCTSSGLSPRETPGRDYATYAYSLYGQQPDSAAPRKPLMVPAKMVVAQLGEVAPPQAMLETLRKDHASFKEVDAIPGVMEISVDSPGPRYGSGERSTNQFHAQQHGEQMRRYARDVGADYLFLFGGTVDRATTGTSLSILDLTIVGGFVVPSKKIQAEARASGSLVDVQSGRVMLTVSADAKGDRMSPTFARESNEIKLLTGMRDQLTQDLAEQLKKRVTSEAARG